MFDHFTNTKGLNNLLWVHAPNRGPVTYAAEYYYPGDDYVDIVGFDYYLYGNTLEPIHERSWPELKALGKPMALTEFGPSEWSCEDPDPQLHPTPDCYDYASLTDEIRAHCPEAVYFLPWWMNWAIVNQINAQGLLDDHWVIARDAVDWRGGEVPMSVQAELTALRAELEALGLMDPATMIARVDNAQAGLTAFLAELEALNSVSTTAMIARVDNALAKVAAFEAAKEETLGIE